MGVLSVLVVVGFCWSRYAASKRVRYQNLMPSSVRRPIERQAGGRPRAAAIGLKECGLPVNHVCDRSIQDFGYPREVQLRPHYPGGDSGRPAHQQQRGFNDEYERYARITYGR